MTMLSAWCQWRWQLKRALWLIWPPRSLFPTLMVLKVWCYCCWVTDCLLIECMLSGCVQLWNDDVGDIARHWRRAVPIDSSFQLFDCTTSSKRRFADAVVVQFILILVFYRTTADRRLVARFDIGADWKVLESESERKAIVRWRQCGTVVPGHQWPITIDFAIWLTLYISTRKRVETVNNKDECQLFTSHTHSADWIWREWPHVISSQFQENFFSINAIIHSCSIKYLKATPHIGFVFSPLSYRKEEEKRRSIKEKQ